METGGGGVPSLEQGGNKMDVCLEATQADVSDAEEIRRNSRRSWTKVLARVH